MQLWFVTVSSNELDQWAIWDTRRLDAVHDTNGLASYLITCKSYNDTNGTLTDWLTEDWRLWRLLLSTLIVRYKCCGNVVVFSDFRYVALALGVVVLLTSLVSAHWCAMLPTPCGFAHSQFVSYPKCVKWTCCHCNPVMLSLKPGVLDHNFLLLWPWPSSNYLHI